MDAEAAKQATEFTAALREWALLQSLAKPDSASEYRRTVPKANRLARRYGRLADELSGTAAGRAALESLMDDPDQHVRSIAAGYCITWGSKDAEQVLREVAQESGLVGLGAEYALRRLGLWTEADNPRS